MTRGGGRTRSPHFAILGPVEVTVDGAPVRIGGPREQKALAALLLSPRQVVTVQRLTRVLWEGEAPPTAKAQVHNTIARLRHHLASAGGDPDLITRSGPGYRIHLADDQCDAATFGARVEAASALTSQDQAGADERWPAAAPTSYAAGERWPAAAPTSYAAGERWPAAAPTSYAAAADLLRGALDLWRGPALDGLRCAALESAARGLDERRLACLERRIELDLALGRHAELIAELAALAGEHPTREGLIRLRMLALYRSGRRLEALDLYQTTRVRLVERTGLDPHPDLDRLHRAILAGDPALDLAPRTPAPAPGQPAPPQPAPGTPAPGTPAPGTPAPGTPAPGTPAPPQPAPGTLPGLPRRVLPRFIGRRRELAELPAELKEHAVVTLTGPPGSGKTRLAIELAAVSAASFSGGVALVPLDTVQDPEGVPAALLAVLAPAGDPWCTPLESLIRLLAYRDALLVLDNCEHLAAGCARLLEVLTAECPRLRVLATSQVPLGLATERVYLVRPLSVPRDGTVPAVEESESGRLLVDRATAVDPRFALSAANSADVARICRALDGLPLALELAAGRQRAFSVGQLAERLDRRLELLSSRRAATRHDSLRAAIDWSYDLLTDRERTVFARLAVFVGGFTLEAAEAVVADEELSPATVMDTLGTLVERSMVVAERHADTPGRMRYRLLESLRAYAGERLTGASAVHGRHARYFLGFAEQADRERRGSRRTRWLRWLTGEYPNLRAAMAWLHATGDHEAGLRYACALIWFWRRFATREALDWLRTAIPAASAAPADLRQRALIGAGSLAIRVSIDEAHRYCQQAAFLAREQADRRMEVKALSFMASVEVYRANAAEVRRHGDRAVDLARAVGDPYLLARTLMARGLTQAHVGEPERGGPDLAEALTLFQGLHDGLGAREVRLARAEVALAAGDTEGIRSSLKSIDVDELADLPSTGAATYWLCRSWLALRDGRYGEVRAHLARALDAVTDDLAGPHAAQRVYGPALDLAAGLALADGEVDRAVTLWHAATGVLTLGGTVPERPQVRWVHEVEERAPARLDPAGYAEAAARGRRMYLAEALRYAGLPPPAH
jgi:predicted ATPase/DNA-binding SARP family transcriptional activator